MKGIGDQKSSSSKVLFNAESSFTWTLTFPHGDVESPGSFITLPFAEVKSLRKFLNFHLEALEFIDTF